MALKSNLYFALAACCLLLVSCGDTKEGGYSERLANHAIYPLYADLKVSLGKFENEVLAACSDKAIKDVERESLQATWLTAYQHWQKAEVINFGLVADQNYQWVFQFWPDKHNNTKRKVDKLITSSEAPDADSLQKFGVVVQGFTAVEYILFDKQFEALAQNYQTNVCAYLAVVSSNLSNVASELAGFWHTDSPYRMQFEAPGADNVLFPDEKVIESLILTAIVTELERIKSSKLAAPLGFKSEQTKANKYFGEAWRSEQSMSLIRANLVSLHELLLNPSYGLVYEIDGELEREKHTATFVLQFQAVDRELASLSETTLEGAIDAKSPEKFTQFYESVLALLKTVKHDLPPALGLTLGFNANDGD